MRHCREVRQAPTTLRRSVVKGVVKKLDFGDADERRIYDGMTLGRGVSET